MFGLALRIGRRLWPAIFVAAVWAVHPLSTEAVTNIVGRADLLAAFGVLGAFSAHLEPGTPDGTQALVVDGRLVSAAMTVAVFSKESARRRRGHHRAIRPAAGGRSRFEPRTWCGGWIIIALPVAVFLVPACCGARRDRLLKFHTSTTQLPAQASGPGRLTALSVMGRYVALLLWPAHLSADYSFSQIPLAQWQCERLDWRGR